MNVCDRHLAMDQYQHLMVSIYVYVYVVVQQAGENYSEMSKLCIAPVLPVHIKTMGIVPSVVRCMCEVTWCNTTLCCVFLDFRAGKLRVLHRE